MNSSGSHQQLSSSSGGGQPFSIENLLLNSSGMPLQGMQSGSPGQSIPYSSANENYAFLNQLCPSQQQIKGQQDLPQQQLLLEGQPGLMSGQTLQQQLNSLPQFQQLQQLQQQSQLDQGLLSQALAFKMQQSYQQQYPGGGATQNNLMQSQALPQQQYQGYQQTSLGQTSPSPNQQSQNQQQQYSVSQNVGQGQNPFQQIQQLASTLSQIQQLFSLIGPIQQSQANAAAPLSAQQPQSYQFASPQPEEKLFQKYFVGGILYSAKEHDIQKYFEQYGNVVDVAIMRDKHTGKSRGFAFVTFQENSKESGMALTQRLINPPTPHIIQNRIIEIREGDGGKPPDSFLDKQGKRLAKNSHHAENEVRGSRHDNRNSDRNGSSKPLVIHQSQDLFKPVGSHHDKRTSSEVDRSHGGGRERRDKGRDFDRKGKNRSQQQQVQQSEEEGGVKDKVFVGGLDYNLEEDEFARHFSQFGRIKECQIVKDPVSGHSRGFGFVTFEKEQVAKHLIFDLKTTEIRGRKVDLRNAEPKFSEKIAQINKQVQDEPSSKHRHDDRKRDKKKRDKDRERERKNVTEVVPIQHSEPLNAERQEKPEEKKEELSNKEEQTNSH